MAARLGQEGERAACGCGSCIEMESSGMWRDRVEGAGWATGGESDYPGRGLRPFIPLLVSRWRFAGRAI
jgi:hypothetical protein